MLQPRVLPVMLATFLFAADGYSAAPPTQPPADRRLVWSDEFSGTALDERCWERDVESPPWDRRQRVAFTDSTRNSYVRDGMLNIDAYRENLTLNGRRNAYSSAQLWTRDRAAWTYGYFEARIKIPSGQGSFPAFWMMPADDGFGYWPHSGEIDIFENIGREPNTIHTSVHFADRAGHDVRVGQAFEAQAPLSDDFHVYGLEWRPGSLRYYLDDQLVYEIDRWISPTQARPFAPFDARFYMILDLAVGGVWAHEPNASTRFPMHMLVDYVRVYALPGVTESNGHPTEGSQCPAAGPG